MKGHSINVTPFFYGVRYVTCKEPGCSRVRRHWSMQPIIHKGRKP